MHGLFLGSAAAAAMIALPGAAQACNGDFLGAYNTVISRQDVFASDGLRLSGVGAILQQDRANYHRYGRRDRGDGYDSMFLSAESRGLLARWRIEAAPRTAAAVRQGRAWVNVRVFEGCVEVRPAG